MLQSLLKSWKTTSFAGLAGFALMFVLFAPEYFQSFPILIKFAKFATAMGLFGLGAAAGDHKPSGGQN
jgi:hypothetical protein